MHVTIITPDNVMYNGEATALSVPSIDGEFQMLENHAAIISVLVKGDVKIKGNSHINERFANHFTQIDGGIAFPINGGTLEFKDNRAVILAD